MKTWVEISRRNLLHNVGQFLSLLPRGVQFMAIVKSNAYGHGLKETTQIIHNSKFKIPDSQMWFGVDNLDEATVVRKIAPHNPVLVLGYTQNTRLKEASRLGVRLTVYNWETLKALENVARDFMSRKGGTRGAALRVHVKVETGTTRQGIPAQEMVDFVKALKAIKAIRVEGISTHFANIEDTARPEYAKSQLTRYNSVIMRLKRAGIEIPLKHTACTAATLLYPETYGNLVRVGIGLYGLWPSEEIHHAMSLRAERSNLTSKMKRSPRSLRSLAMTKLGVDLKLVLAWKTIVAQVKEVKRGTPVSYGLTERVKRNSKVAVLPVGYWDGYDRGLSRIGYVLINGARCKVLGRVCMNMTMVDVTDAGRVKLEDEVVLIGRQGRGVVAVDEIAEKLDTIHYEVVTRINPLIPRVIV